MSARKSALVLGLAMVLALLLGVFSVWAEGPEPTDKYDRLDSLYRPVWRADSSDWSGAASAANDVAPSTLPVTGNTRARDAAVARWNGWAARYLGAAGFTRAQKADAARWNGWAEWHASKR